VNSDKGPGQRPKVKRKRRRGRKHGSGPPGNTHTVKAGAWAVLSEVRGLRAAPRERVESMARTTAGFISDLGRSHLLDLSTSKRLLLESVVGQVEMRRAWEGYILSRETREEFLAALEKIVGSGHYLALCNSLRASLDKLGAWERIPKELEADGNLERLREQYRTEGAASPPIARALDATASRLPSDTGDGAEDVLEGETQSKDHSGDLHGSSAKTTGKLDGMAESAAPLSSGAADGGSRDPPQNHEAKNETVTEEA